MAFASVSPAVGRPPTASELLYLLGTLALDDLVPAGSARRLGGQLHDPRPGLAPLLVAAALWHLRDEALISLHVVESRAFGFLPRTEVVAAAHATEIGRPGIEGALLAVLARQSPRRVRDLVRDWFGGPDRNPQATVVGRVLHHAQAAGLVEVRLEDAGRGVVAGMLLGKTKRVIAPVPEMLVASGPTLDRLAEGWLAFNDAEERLATELIERCRKAIDSKELRELEVNTGD
jgi:hypothetical protein